MTAAPTSNPPPQAGISRSWALLLDLLLVLVLLAGAFLRLNGLNWGESQYLHPDERFLAEVGSQISPVMCADPTLPASQCPPDQKHWITLGEYFDTARSSLNPANAGKTFYVYGTFPMFLTRYVVEWVYGHSGYDEMIEIGRGLSALADLATLLLVFAVARRLYNRRVALLATAFSAFAVLQIQQSHFFTMDTFVNLFMLLAFYFAARLLTTPVDPGAPAGFFRHPWFGPSLGFGIALGLAVASKLNAAPVAAVLPLAFILILISLPPRERERLSFPAFGYLVLAAAVSLLVFRIFQPYAFTGPGFFGVGLNPLWLDTIQQLRVLTGRDADFPPAMQWARRPVWFSFQNLVLWGLGLPLGLLAWSGFAWAGWRMLKNFRIGPAAPATEPPSGLQRYTLSYTLSAAEGGVEGYTLSAVEGEVEGYTLSAVEGGAEGYTLNDARWEDEGEIEGTVGPPYPSTTLRMHPERSRRTHPERAGDAGSRRISPPDRSGTLTSERSLRMASQTPWQSHALIWLWTAAYFGWQSLGHNPTLRYQLPIYPLLAIFAAWLVIALYDLGKDRLGRAGAVYRLLAVALGAAVLVATGLYAFAFSQIYSRPITRLEASRWIYQNVPGPVNLRIQTIDGLFSQPAPFYYGSGISALEPYTMNFTARESGLLEGVYLPHVLDIQGIRTEKPLDLELYRLPDGESPVAVGRAVLGAQVSDPRGDPLTFTFASPPQIQAGESYVIRLQVPPETPGRLVLSGAGLANEGDWDDAAPWRMDGYDPYGGLYPADMGLNMYIDDGPEKLARFQRILDAADYLVITSSRQWGSLPRIPERYPMTTVYYRELIGCPNDLSIEYCYNVAAPGSFTGRLGFELIETFTSSPQIGPLKINDQFAEEAFTVYDHPKVFIFQKTPAYRPEHIAATLGAVDFDQIIHKPPLHYGSYPATLTLPPERWEAQQASGTWSALFDTAAPQNRSQILGVLLWYASLFLLGLAVYPLVRRAFPGLADGGYPLSRIAGLLLLSWLVWVLGSAGVPFERPLIFAIAALIALAGLVLAYRDRRGLRERIGARPRARLSYYLVVEALFLAFFALDLLIRFANPDIWHPWFGGEKPMDFSYFNAVLKSSSFPPYDPWYAGGYLNYYYYGFVFAGVLVKALGIVPAVAYNLILPSIFAMIAMGAFSLAWNLVSWRRASGIQSYTLSEVEGYTLSEVEGYTLSEAEGYTLSEAEGKVEASILSEVEGPTPNAPTPGIPSRALSKVEGEVEGPAETVEETPSDALRLRSARQSGILSEVEGPAETVEETPSEALRLRSARQSDTLSEAEGAVEGYILSEVEGRPLLAGIAGALGMALLGNLGTVRMIYQGYQKLAAPGGVIDDASLPTRLVWAIRGLAKAVGGESLPYATSHWYWLPSRVIPAPGDVEPITEFPFFTVLYADLHAHLFAMPIALLALGFVISVAIAGARWRSAAGAALGFFFGALAIGALRPTNTWDFYPYLALACVALFYSLAVHFQPGANLVKRFPSLAGFPPYLLRGLAALGETLLLAGLAFLLYQPFAQWYGQGYNEIMPWEGTHTPISSYLAHWGLFLFVITSWLFAETVDWMASTPLSSLVRLRPHRGWIVAAAGALLAALGILLLLGVSVAWLALPLAAWAGVLLLRPGQPDAKRLVLFMLGTGFTLTLMVELIVLKGDIGRMNTVFKFYLQVWTLFAVSSAAALGWLLTGLPRWSPRLRGAWQAALILLVAGAAMYPVMAGVAKMKDRMVMDAPHTLDGMLYMRHATYDWEGFMDLSQDYAAIRWMQENVQGSPVIVEANIRDLYRWGSRYSIYTGLPGVVGWEWHQQQQRAVNPGVWVSQRIAEVDNFYNTTDVQAALDFLRKYDVRYIVVGQLEANHYPGPGLDKFALSNGIFWQEVFRIGNTVIYEVDGEW